MGVNPTIVVPPKSSHLEFIGFGTINFINHPFWAAIAVFLEKHPNLSTLPEHFPSK